jgi:hypothetical protein
MKEIVKRTILVFLLMSIITWVGYTVLTAQTGQIQAYCMDMLKNGSIRNVTDCNVTLLR